MTSVFTRLVMSHFCIVLIPSLRNAIYRQATAPGVPYSNIIPSYPTKDVLLYLFTPTEFYSLTEESFATDDFSDFVDRFFLFASSTSPQFTASFLKKQCSISKKGHSNLSMYSTTIVISPPAQRQTCHLLMIIAFSIFPCSVSIRFTICSTTSFVGQILPK